MIAKTTFAVTLMCLLVGTGALRWTKSGLPSTEDLVISLNTITYTPIIDVASEVQVTILQNANVNFHIVILCFITGNKDGSKTEYHFCKDDDCDVTISETARVTRNVFNMDVSFETSFPGKKGLMVNMTTKVSSRDHSGNYYCKASNGKFAIRSNYIEIRDLYYWRRHLFRSTDFLEKPDTGSITADNVPQKLNCSNGNSILDPSAPKWTKAEFVSPVMWTVCPVYKDAENLPANKEMTLEKCKQFTKERCDDIDPEICPRSLKSIPEWKAFVDHNGDLVFTGIDPLRGSNIGSFSLLCYTKSSYTLEPIFYYFGKKNDNGMITKGVTFDGTPKVKEDKLEAISNITQSFDIYARKVTKDRGSSSLMPVTVYALYRGSVKATYHWKKDGHILNSNNIVKTGPYTLTFNGAITSDLAGTYALEVRDRGQSLSMEINLRVLGPPVLVTEGCMSELEYVWVGGGVKIECQYKQRPKDIKIEINSQQINLNSSVEVNKVNLQTSNPYLEKLNFSTSLKTHLDGNTAFVGYTVKNLRNSEGHDVYQDHTVTFLVSNEFGSSVKTKSIYVLPNFKSVVARFPVEDNCKQPCRSSEDHYFHCDVRVKEYANKELRVEHYWTINSNRLDDPNYAFARYFEVDPNTKRLTMFPIKTNDTVKDKAALKVLRSNYVECHVRLIAINRHFEYFSSLDKAVSGSMRASITLDAKDLSFVYYMVTAILIIILLLIIAFLLHRHLKRFAGETYMLEKLEKKCGHDPEKEAMDQQIFMQYMPHVENNVQSSGYGEGQKPLFSSFDGNDEGDLHGQGKKGTNDNGSLASSTGANSGKNSPNWSPKFNFTA